MLTCLQAKRYCEHKTTVTLTLYFQVILPKILSDITSHIFIILAYIYIYMSRVLSTVVKKSKAVTRLMQSSSNKLCIPVSDSAKCKQTKANTKCDIIPELTWGDILSLA